MHAGLCHALLVMSSADGLTAEISCDDVLRPRR